MFEEVTVHLYTETEADVRLKEEERLASEMMKKVSNLIEKLNSESYY